MRPLIGLVVGRGALALAPSAHAVDQRNFAVITLSGFGQPHVLRVIDANGAPVRTVFSRQSNSGITSPTWSPDEATNAYSEGQQLLTVSSAGGAEQPLATGSLPSFSPVGDEIAFWRGGKSCAPSSPTAPVIG